MRALSAQGLGGDELRHQAYSRYMENECPKEWEACNHEIQALQKKVEVTWKGWKETMVGILKEVG